MYVVFKKSYQCYFTCIIHVLPVITLSMFGCKLSKLKRMQGSMWSFRIISQITTMGV